MVSPRILKSIPAFIQQSILRYFVTALANSFEQEVPRVETLVCHPQLRSKWPSEARPPCKITFSVSIELVKLISLLAF